MDASRGVTCGIVSSPTVRSIATAAMSAESRARHRVVVDVGDVNRARLLEPRSDAQHRFHVRPLRRVELDRDDPLACFEPLLQQRSTARPAGRSPRSRARRRTSAAAARAPARRAAWMAAICAGVVPQQPPMIRALAARLRGELAEVVRRRVGIDDAPAGAAGQADVRLGRERKPVALRAHLAERRQRGLRPRHRSWRRSRPRRGPAAARMHPAPRHRRASAHPRRR